jgi:hypothetical protein
VYVLSGGRGKYAGISGHGQYTFHLVIVYRHTASGCSKKPIAAPGIVQTRGPATLP